MPYSSFLLTLIGVIIYHKYIINDRMCSVKDM
nr:MAG TPA: hypothetical protein [Caudoviricetes sp.]